VSDTKAEDCVVLASPSAAIAALREIDVRRKAEAA